MSPSLHKAKIEAGFTLLEVMVAISILTVGLMAMALLMARTYSSTTRSRYMSMAATLASEKLEDLEHYKKTDAYLTPGGSLATVPPNTYVNGYYDLVGISMAGGTYQELTVKGASSSDLFSLSSNGSQPTSAYVTTATSNVGMTFARQWMIENNVPTNGVARITVLVTLLDITVQPTVTFQMSAVRECLLTTSTSC